MADYINSTNMNLPVPIVSQAPGPDYATDINACLTIVDGHTHSPGSGVQITADAINIGSDFPMNSNNLTLVKSLRFTPQAAVLVGANDLGCLYEVGVDLYYNDGSGNNVRITQSGGVAGSPGSIANLTSPASATYVAANSTFVWQSAASTPAVMDGGSVIIRKLSASSNGITLAAPSALASNFTLTLPPTLPASQKFVTMDSSGNITAPWAVDGTSLEISSNTLQIKALGVSTAKIADSAVTTAKIADLNVTQGKLQARVSGGTTATLGQIAVCSSSGSFTRTTATFSNVTNQAWSIVTGGRPVRIDLVSDGSTLGYIGIVTAPSVGAGSFNWRIQRGGVTVATGQMAINGLDTSVATHDYRIPPSIGFTDVVAAGTYNYAFQVQGDGASTAAINGLVIKAYEV